MSTSWEKILFVVILRVSRDVKARYLRDKARKNGNLNIMKYTKKGNLFHILSCMPSFKMNDDFVVNVFNSKFSFKL